MADAVATQVLHESASSLTVKFTSISDGTGESAVTKVDVSALTPACSEVALEKLWYATDGMAVRILWDATTDVVAWLVPQNQHGFYDFTKTVRGCIPNDAGTGKTGDVQFTTVGHTSGDTYTIIGQFKKIA